MKRGTKTLITGIVLFVLGAVLVPVVFIVSVVLGDSADARFLGPGTLEVEVETPGRYYLWNDYRTVFDGRSYNRSESLPDGLEISVRDADGDELKFVTDTSFSSSSGIDSKNSIGYVEVDSPGTLTVSVSGNAEARVFSFAQPVLWKIFGLLLGGIGISMLIALAGVGIAIWGIALMVKE